MAKAVQVGSYADFFRVLGLEAVSPGALRQGRFNRIPRLGRRRDDAGWVLLFPDGAIYGGSHSLGDEVRAYFNENSGKRLTQKEWAELKRRKAEIERREDEERKRRQDAAALTAVALMHRAEPYRQHPYMVKKHLYGDYFPTLRVISDKALWAVLGYLPAIGDGARMSGDILMAPLYTAVRGRPVLRNVQLIDADGAKRFLPGGQKKGCFWVSRGHIRESQGVIGVCEGVATALSVAADIAENEGQIPVIAAMDAGNLAPVAEIIQRLFFDRVVVVFGDWDESGRGQEAARKAAAQTRCGRVQFPPIDEQITRQFQLLTGSDKAPSDFNDYLITIGRL